MTLDWTKKLVVAFSNETNWIELLLMVSAPNLFHTPRSADECRMPFLPPRTAARSLRPLVLACDNVHLLDGLAELFVHEVEPRSVWGFDSAGTPMLTMVYWTIKGWKSKVLK